MSETPPPFHSQPHPQPYSQRPHSSLRPRPMPPPRHMRRRWRYRGGFIAGMILFLLAASTLYLGAPENYFDSLPPSDAAAPPEAMAQKIPPQIIPPEEIMPQEAWPQKDFPEEIFPEGILPREAAPREAMPQEAAPREATPREAMIREGLTGYFVQLSSQRSRRSSARRFAALQRDHSDLLGRMSPVIKRADLGARGVFYRLSVGPFSDKQAADNLCAELKQRGEDCFVRKI